MGQIPPQQAPAAIAERLRTRRAEIEQAVLTRIHGVSDPAEVGDPEYAEGLRAAVAAAIDYGLETVERGEERAPPIPTALLAQARVAARNSVSLDTVLRRYFAGYALLGDYLIEEASESGLGGGALKRLLRAQASLLDRLLAAVSEEHARERQLRSASSQERHAERVQRLLAGELIEIVDMPYDFEAIHLGAIAKGPGGAEALRELARALDRRLLLVRHGEETVWAWLGGRRAVDVEAMQRLVPAALPPEVSIAVGELGEGLAGWRLSHQQARAALPVALRSPEPLTRYADVALLASVLQDDLLVTSLRQLYLAPLECEPDAGELARKTLRAYFVADRNVSSAAAALGVSRQAVARRLRSVERRIGRSLGICGIELEAALRLEDLTPSLRGDQCVTS